MKGKKIISLAVVVLGLLGAVKAEAGWLDEIIQSRQELSDLLAGSHRVETKAVQLNEMTIDPPIMLANVSKPITGVNVVRPHSVMCEHCTGSGGGSELFQCPANYVVTGSEVTWHGIPYESGKYLVIGALSLSCTHLGVDKVESFEDEVDAITFPDGKTIAGTKADSMADLSLSCAPYTGVARGIFGRSGDRLDSFGLFCGRYFRKDTDTFSVDPKDVVEKTWEHGEYRTLGADLNGLGGSPFDATCGPDQVLTGIQIRHGGDVDGIEGIVCSELEGVR